MLGYILFGYTLSVFIVYVLISEWGPEDVGLGLRLISAIFWPIIVLVNALRWLVERPILRPMWILIGRGLKFVWVFVGKGLILLLGLIFLLTSVLDFVLGVLGPIFRPISALWSRWLDRWPKSKRWVIEGTTIIVVIWTPAAFCFWSSGKIMLAISYWGMAAAALITILIIYLRVKKKKVSSS